MSDTPRTLQAETVAMSLVVGDDYTMAYREMVECARELERERDELLEALKAGYANGYETAIETAAQHVENQHCVWSNTQVPIRHVIQALANNIRALKKARGE